MTPEKRAKALFDACGGALLDEPKGGLYSDMPALIAAIRAAEDEALDRAMALADSLGWVSVDGIRALKSPSSAPGGSTP